MASKDLRETRFKGHVAQEVTVFLWPEIELERMSADEAGDALGRVFGRYHGAKVLIKFDERIAETNKIWVEFFEKTLGFPEQPWRYSPHDCSWYVFVTVDLAMLVSVDVLGRTLAKRKLLMEKIPGTLDSEGLFFFRGELERAGGVEVPYELSPELMRRWQEVLGRRWPGSHAAEAA